MNQNIIHSAMQVVERWEGDWLLIPSQATQLYLGFEVEEGDDLELQLTLVKTDEVEVVEDGEIISYFNTRRFSQSSHSKVFNRRSANEIEIVNLDMAFFAKFEGELMTSTVLSRYDEIYLTSVTKMKARPMQPVPVKP